MPCLVCVLLSCVAAGGARADSLKPLLERLDRFEAENRRLREEVDALAAERTERTGRSGRAASTAAPERPARSLGFVRFDSRFAHELLDPTARINRKQRLILERRNDGTLAPYTLHLQGAVTAFASYQKSNREDRFGYLMRHPTVANQVGDTVSEAAVHSAQLGLTGTVGDWLTGHAQMLFAPKQSFGSGTDTDLERNQVQVRRAYVLFGDLGRAPFHASVGKMAVPFGLTDTVSPFSASVVWHTFGALANGVTLGFAGERLSVSVAGVQGGAQFRAANTPVRGTAVPSRLNNLAVDASYRLETGPTGSFLLGASYLHGSAYCQGYPVAHFRPCLDNNPALDSYAKFVLGDFTFQAEIARTTRAWPGTFNPAISRFPASRVTSFEVGAKYRHYSARGPIDFSAAFGRFDAGPDGAPWERQDQLVLGAAWFPRPSAKLFAEYVRVDGFAPLNFISGGSVRSEQGEVIPNRTHSDRAARSNVFLVGVNLAF
ncbi:MAG: hypothetical protein OXC01_15895 [Immundisolibacterales bacterium]|nr:hypothetical protein [Immundisolibacterales bacterium]